MVSSVPWNLLMAASSSLCKSCTRQRLTRPSYSWGNCTPSCVPQMKRTDDSPKPCEDIVLCAASRAKADDLRAFIGRVVQGTSADFCPTDPEPKTDGLKGQGSCWRRS